ncbi:MBL fold metallo-hydrolase [Amnibacterium flavum]|uniref:Hydrolase n=1 Tax=Amnibacterium flavum TaxID=2173173 RepID=A0A2V1HS20_9MICO|nr:MBL fold metallo-hydrolase [Amnibacterium flavum]PVZ95393.1 hydrolase [Amnibacterium flavum]
MTFWICETCAVEHAQRTDVCQICADERQWVPADGQKWTTLEELAVRGVTVSATELEPGLLALATSPEVGIGQQSKLVTTPAGSVLWDPIGYLDDDVVDRILGLGPVLAIVASHPHMFGVQVEWARRLGAPVLVADADAGWVQRRDDVIRPWNGAVDLAPGLTLLQVGGHFPGSAVLHWADGAEGRGVLLSGDTIFANPDRVTVSFMRSYPNRIPLSAAVVDRVATAVGGLRFDRLYGNFDNVIPVDANAVIRRSADRHIQWVTGVNDYLT